jgi:hypothetical protein
VGELGGLQMSKEPKPTWRQALTEKLKDHPRLLNRILELTENKKLDREFTDWVDWSCYANSFSWGETKEKGDFWYNVSRFLKYNLEHPPELPKEHHDLDNLKVVNEELFKKAYIEGVTACNTVGAKQALADVDYHLEIYKKEQSK